MLCYANEKGMRMLRRKFLYGLPAAMALSTAVATGLPVSAIGEEANGSEIDALVATESENLTTQSVGEESSTVAEAELVAAVEEPTVDQVTAPDAPVEGTSSEVARDEATDVAEQSTEDVTSEGTTYTVQATSSDDDDLDGNTFVLKTNTGVNKVADVASASTEDGANVQLWDANGTSAQSWTFESNDDGTYRIVSLTSGLVLDVDGGVAEDGRNVQQYTWNQTNAQKWYVSWVDEKAGIATLLSAIDTSYALDLAGADTSSGTNLQLWTANGTKAQQWIIADVVESYLSEGTYTFYSGVGNDQVLDVSGGSFDNGANVQTYESNDTSAQRWYLAESGTGYTFRNIGSGLYLSVDGSNVIQSNTATVWNVSYNTKNSSNPYVITTSNGLALDVSGASSSNGTNVQTYKSNLTVAQGWLLSAVDIIADGYYEIASSLANSLRLDVDGASMSDGGNVQVYTQNGTAAQLWSISKLDNGNYRIVSNASNKALDVTGGSSKSGANVQQYEINGTAAQEWKIKMGAHGLVFTNVGSGKVLDVSGASTSDGTNVQQYEANGTKAQGWHLKSSGTSFTTALQNFVNYLRAMAEDDSHGYDQEYRWGQRGDYDCSSLVISCAQWAGFDTGSSTYTGNMRSEFTARGWEEVYINDISQLQAGDILLNDIQHTSAMVSDYEEVAAHSNEYDDATGGQPGDQTGEEINVRNISSIYANVSSWWWNVVLRPTIYSWLA